jgi:hypothetical protein
MSDIQEGSVVDVQHNGQSTFGIVDRVFLDPESLSLLTIHLQVDGEFRKNELFHIINDGEKFRARNVESWRQGEIQKLVVRVEIPER